MRKLPEKIITGVIGVLLVSLFVGLLYVGLGGKTYTLKGGKIEKKSNFAFNEQMLVRRGSTNSIEAQYLIYTYDGITIKKINPLNRTVSTLGSMKLTLTEPVSLVVSSSSDLVTMKDGGLYVLITPYPFGCTKEENLAPERCQKEIELITSDYKKYGGIWKFDLESKKFTHQVKMPDFNHDEFKEILELGKLDENTLTYVVYTRDPEGKVTSQNFTLKVSGGEVKT